VGARSGPAPIDAPLPQRAEEPSALPDRTGWRGELDSLDLAVYMAIAATPTPGLDRVIRRLSRAADHSRSWLASAAVGDRRRSTGRRAAVDGLASMAVTSTVVNLLLKPLGRRHRPHRAAHHVPISRQVTMPRTASSRRATRPPSPPAWPLRGPRPGSPSAPPQRSSGTQVSTRASTTPST
jgi:hypothetical protein